MKTHVQVAVIGGGVVGASVLYHLARGGWKDVVLLERDELTSGSTWHAAGGMHTLNGDPNVAKLQEYPINLYKEIEEASGQSCGIHITAGVDLAGTPARMDFLKLAFARARYLVLDMELDDQLVIDLDLAFLAEVLSRHGVAQGRAIGLGFGEGLGVRGLGAAAAEADLSGGERRARQDRQHPGRAPRSPDAPLGPVRITIG